MKSLLGVFFAVFVLCAVHLFSETKKGLTDVMPQQKRSAPAIKAEGIVSHKFKKSGCGTVIMCKKGKETTTLIPTIPLGKFDVDGMDVLVTFRMVRIPNPPGCIKGMPAQILSIMVNKK